MTVLNVSNLKKEFGTNLLFDGVSFQIEDKDKVGLVGANGAGKTTLFQLLLGRLPSDGGAIHQSKDAILRYLEQHANEHSQHTVWDEVMAGFAPLLAMERELEQIATELEHGGDDFALVERQHTLSGQFQQAGGFVFRSHARGALLGLGFAEAEFTLPVACLSGGQKTRVSLCKILLSGANLLLLDEPTNHLDLGSVEWLEGFLREYKGAFIVISHDRYFLDRVTNRTFDLSARTLTVYEGNYSAFAAVQQERQKAIARKYEQDTKEIKRLEGIIAQQRQWNRERNIRMAESKQKSIDRLEQTLVKPQEEEDAIRFSFGVKQRGGNDVLACHDLSMAFDQKQLFDHLSLLIKRQERVFLLGPNGCGKTTLFNLLTGHLTPHSGTIKHGANIEIGYFDQLQQHLDPNKTPFAEVADAYPALSQTAIRNALAAFLFQGDEVFQPIRTLSGGERARVALVKLMLSGANFLLLDEPTNHLDIASREALEQALQGYEGTLLIISHDRYLINKIATRICDMTPAGLVQYQGNYDDFAARKKQAQPDPTSTPEKKGKNDYLLKKEKEAAQRKRQAALKKTEQQIEQLEAQIEGLKEELSSPACAADYLRAMELTAQVEGLEAQLEPLYHEWDRQSEEASL